MSASCSCETNGGHRPSASARGPTEVLALAASPTLTVMALLTIVFDRGQADILCSAFGPSPLDGMAIMYLVMSVLHAGPWLKVVFDRQ